ncbi:superfamily II DNA/RNA helicase [Branchiibius hedensis]|uniref:Superfamily II DNA and RNA helicase n=1 Tax=Branchiibius hedensis TaxID=672460 RepID=A0A2Y8ZY31_9MICO|nr:DEAD/DEAH box helicase [Branchiibius hedensis]PWJ25985.1 superfamily II DNA/RNA helicase [Branchiibius hedensis]SSA34797.1 Superfamily II DNA and RNA helicase [Branchiibius hedensis]
MSRHSTTPAAKTAGKKPRWTREQKLAAQKGKSSNAYAKDSKSRPERESRPRREDNRSYGDRPQRSDDRRYDNRRDENRSYGDRRDNRSYGDRPQRSDDRRYDNRRDENRSYGERRDNRSYGERRDNRSYGDRPQRSDDRRYDNRRDENRSYGERRDNRSYGERRDNRSYDNRRDNRSYGDRPQRSDDRRYDNRRDDTRSYGERPERRTHSRPQQTTTTRAAAAARIQEPIDMSDNGFAALGLPEVLVERLARDGITEPFPIQQAAIPDALAGRDVLGRGRTGSGKTLAFGLPTLTRLMGSKARPHQPRAIVLVPTRELAMQVSDALQPLVHVAGLHHKLVAGGMPYEPQLSALARGVDLLIATPGRLSDLIARGAADLSAVQIAILDEADHMAEMGFLEAITEILDLVPEGGQRLLFSATLDRGIDTVVDRYLTDPVTHSTDDGTASVTTMEHHALLIEPRDKKVVTAEVANRTGRTVVFVRTKLGADRVATELREQGIVAAALHGGLNQGQRNKVLGAFKDGRIPVLVATDVAARGIHVDDVSLVLQIDPPADHKDYLHRAGRTARAGEAGTVVTLALPHQRKGVQRLLDEAGVGIQLTKARPGDDIIAAAGGSRPSGDFVSQSTLEDLLTPPGQRDRGHRGGPRGYRGGPRRPGQGRGEYRGDRRGGRSERSYSRAGRD